MSQTDKCTCGVKGIPGFGPHLRGCPCAWPETNARPLDDERKLVEQAFVLLAEAREGVDGFGAWPEADEMDSLLRDWRGRLDALLTAADAPVIARRERERRAAERQQAQGFGG